MTDPTIHDLHILLTEINGDVKSVAKDVSALKAGFDAHIVSDVAEFKTVNDNINNMNKYGRSIAIVASIFGAGIALGLQTGLEWIKNKVS